MKRTTIVLLFIIFTLLSYSQQQGDDRFAKVVNRLVEAMNTPDYAAIVREYDKGMSAAIPLDRTTIFFKNIESQYGKVKKFDPPTVKAVDQAICVMYFERGAQEINLYLDDQGKIKGFMFTTHVAPEPQTTPAQTQTSTPTASPKPIETQPVAPVVPDKQKTELYPPFKGAWIVLTGGELPEGAAAQRNLLLQQYAYDFSGMDANELRYKTDGKTNEDYIGYGNEVLAPANGTVVEAIDGVRENSPGMRNPYAPIGNAIVIQHSGSEFSVLAFLKQGSIRVKVGDIVTRGQVIAQCGSSGNATEPAIHYHLQDSPFLQTAKGIKFYFERAIVGKEGKKELKLIHFPQMGDVIGSE